MNPPDLVRLVRFLGKVDVFEGIDDSVLERVAGTLEFCQLGDQSALFRQGDLGQDLYFVLQGRLRVTTTRPDGIELTVAERPAGTTVGEMQALTGGVRSANVYACGETTLGRLSPDAFTSLVSEAPAVAGRIAVLTQHRMWREQLRPILLEFFGALDEQSLGAIDVSWVRLERGELLFRQGEPSDDFYFVVSGLLLAVTEERGEERRVEHIARGEAIGEATVFTGEPRLSSVRALRQSVLARLDGAHFRELCLRSPDGLVSTVRLGLERLKRNIRRPAVCRNLAVLPVGADAPRFVARLAGALSRIVSAAVHTSVELDARFPALAGLTSDDPRRVRLDAWLDQHELQHELMLYQADSAPTAWSRLCLARADRVLIVADAGCDPEPGALEMAWSAMHRPGFSVPTSLVLLHPTSVERPGATESWLRPRAVDAVHHVRPERADDVARTARIVSGRAIGLALGGGGARGIAHVGVIRALEEAGIPIDVMAGTSTGAVISAQHAMGMRWDAMMEAFRHFAAQKPHRDYSLPLVGLIGGGKFVRAMGAMFGDKRLEDLWLEVGIVSADLSSAKKRVHRRGSIVQALRASCALPAIAVPAVEDGHLLVDGGVLDNVPGRLLRDRCGTVIAVDVSPDVDLVVDPAWDSVPSPWRLLWSRLNPFGTPLAAPTIAEIIARTMVLASRSSRDETMAAADLYLRPPVGEFRTLAVTDFERILEAGYQHARAQLAEWRKTARLPVLD